MENPQNSHGGLVIAGKIESISIRAIVHGELLIHRRLLEKALKLQAA